MQRHELKARVVAGTDEWRNNLEVMKARAGAVGGDARTKKVEMVSELQQQFDALKVQAAKTWDCADDKWDQASRDMELKWDEWELRAKQALNDLRR
jgi:acetolactate synthase regulatory subunit